MGSRARFRRGSSRLPPRSLLWAQPRCPASIARRAQASGWDSRHARQGRPLIASKADRREQGGCRSAAGSRPIERSTAQPHASAPSAGSSVEPGRELRLISARTGDHRLQLERGTLRATIWSPPGQFCRGHSASSTAVDLGCAYTMTVDDDDVGHIRVTTGWVGFEWRGRESFIPAGATCLHTSKQFQAPDTGFYDDTSAAFQVALDTLEVSRADAVGHASRRARSRAVRKRGRKRHGDVVASAVARRDGPLRGRVFDPLAQFVPPPSGVTRDGVLAGQKQMLDDWWDTLGLGTAAWWRTWKTAASSR